MEIKNTDFFIKHVEKEFSLRGENFNRLKITIEYNKLEKSYYVRFMPENIIGNLISLLPQLERSYRLLTVNRRSKKAIKRAIELFNNDIDTFIELISPIYKVKFTKEELYID